MSEIELLEWIVKRGLEYSLTYRNGEYCLLVWRPEWITNDLYQARACPEWKANTLPGLFSEFQNVINKRS